MDQELLKQVTAKANEWLSPAYDAATQAEVKAMLEQDDKTPLVDSFYQDLEFGTGGLRGIISSRTAHSMPRRCAVASRLWSMPRGACRRRRGA